MTKPDKKKLLQTNAILWLIAMLLPALFHFTLGATKFPWPVLVPLLLIGCLLASNNLIAKAAGESKD